MKRKRQQKHVLSGEDKAIVDLGNDMLVEVLKRGGCPAIIIAAKATHQAGYLDYFISSPLPKEKILYVLHRVIGLLEGTIPKRTPDEMN